MHRGIQPHAEYLDSTNLQLLDGLDFRLPLCSDDPNGKFAVIGYLEDRQVGFIDVAAWVSKRSTVT